MTKINNTTYNIDTKKMHISATQKPEFKNNLSNDSVSFSGNSGEKRKIIAVCDSFDEQAFDVDNDTIPDLSHGEVVSRAIKQENPDADILNINIKNFSNFNENAIQKTADALDKVNKLVDKGENIKAVNLSFDARASISGIAEKTNLDITPQNIHKYKDFLRNEVFNARDNHEDNIFRITNKDEFRSMSNVINSIEKLTERGVNVFIGAGNSGSDELNLYTLAKGSIPVGAIDPKTGKLADYSADNSIVKEYKPTNLFIKPVKKDDRVIGYSTSNDNKVDIPVEETSGARFIGKEKDKILAKPEDYKVFKKYRDIIAKNYIPEYAGFTKEDIKNINNKVYSIKEIEKVYDNSEKTDRIKALGNYTDASLNLAFKTDENDKFYIHDLASTSDVEGTSYTTPVALSELFRKPDCPEK